MTFRRPSPRVLSARPLPGRLPQMSSSFSYPCPIFDHTGLIFPLFRRSAPHPRPLPPPHWLSLFPLEALTGPSSLKDEGPGGLAKFRERCAWGKRLRERPSPRRAHPPSARVLPSPTCLHNVTCVQLFSSTPTSSYNHNWSFFR